MVVFVDLDDDDSVEGPLARNNHGAGAFSDHHSLLTAAHANNRSNGAGPHESHPHAHDAVERPNPNINTFSAALGCYPIVAQLATLLDLNDLDALSRSCRQFRANLLQYRDQLVRRTLTCTNEEADNGQRLADGLRGLKFAWENPAAGASHTFTPSGVGQRQRERNGPGFTAYSGRITSGKVAKCARDLVGECRRCGVVMCRVSSLTLQTAPLMGR